METIVQAIEVAIAILIAIVAKNLLFMWDAVASGVVYDEPYQCGLLMPLLEVRANLRTP